MLISPPKVTKMSELASEIPVQTAKPRLECIDGGAHDQELDLSNLTNRLDSFVAQFYASPLERTGMRLSRDGLRLGQITGSPGDCMHYSPTFLQFILETSGDLARSGTDDTLHDLNRYVCNQASAELLSARSDRGKLDIRIRNALIERAYTTFSDRPAVQVAKALIKDLRHKDLDCEAVALDATAALGLLLSEQKGDTSGIRALQDQG